MISEVFYWVLNMSIVSTLTFFVVFLISRIKIIPKNIICLIFSIPYLRMIIPFGFSSRFSLANLFSDYVKIVEVDNSRLSSMNALQFAQSYSPVTYKNVIAENVFNIAGIIWIIVATALLIFLVYCYVSTILQLKSAKVYKDNVYFSNSAEGVAVYGIIKPKIVLPISYKNMDLTYVLAHEKAHIKRLDNLWRILVLLITLIHWFNPYAWIMLRVFLSNLELACDEKVIKEIGESNKKKYALAILKAQESKRLIPSSFGGSKTRNRINNILNFKTATIVSTICFVIFAVFIAFILLTNAV